MSWSHVAPDCSSLIVAAVWCFCFSYFSILLLSCVDFFSVDLFSFLIDYFSVQTILFLNYFVFSWFRYKGMFGLWFFPLSPCRVHLFVHSFPNKVVSEHHLFMISIWITESNMSKTNFLNGRNYHTWKGKMKELLFFKKINLPNLLLINLNQWSMRIWIWAFIEFLV